MRQSLAIERGAGSGSTIHCRRSTDETGDTVTRPDPVNLRGKLAR